MSRTRKAHLRKAPSEQRGYSACTGSRRRKPMTEPKWFVTARSPRRGARAWHPRDPYGTAQAGRGRCEEAARDALTVVDPAFGPTNQPRRPRFRRDWSRGTGGARSERPLLCTTQSWARPHSLVAPN